MNIINYKPMLHKQRHKRQVRFWPTVHSTKESYQPLLLPPANKGWGAIFLAFFSQHPAFSPLSEQRWALDRKSRCFLGWIDWSDCRAQNIGIMRVAQSASSVENRAAASQGSDVKHFYKKSKEYLQTAEIKFLRYKQSRVLCTQHHV